MNRNLALVRNRKFQEHLISEPCEDVPERLKAIDRALFRNDLARTLPQLESRLALEDDLVRVHNAQYIESINAHAKTAERTASQVQIYYDTFIDSISYQIARLAAGAGLTAVDAVKNGPFRSSFVLCRPPGHHASADKGMGYCLFNNVAIAARYAQQVLGIDKIAIIDWDVHHGNGTQSIFFDDPSVLFVSIHEYPLFPPDSGWYSEDGVADGRGFTVNVPLPVGTGDLGYLTVWDEIVSPVIQEYKPDLVLLSAGFDAHGADPLGHQGLSTGGYAHLSQRVFDLAEKTGVVGFLEGGYNMTALANSVVACLKVFRDEGMVSEVETLSRTCANGQNELTANRSDHILQQRLRDTKKYLSRYWRSLR
jgi:acetoin utilization deacetylase AcuC-like enzyme